MTASKRSGDGWARVGASSATKKRLGRCGGIWEHSSGCLVVHCGHPTALNPYYATLPDGSAPKVLFPDAFRGKKTIPAFIEVPKFAELRECQEWILKVFAGETGLDFLQPVEYLPGESEVETIQRIKATR